MKRIIKFTALKITATSFYYLQFEKAEEIKRNEKSKLLRQGNPDP
jgi:hypothetical protein